MHPAPQTHEPQRISVGTFCYNVGDADLLFNQCDGLFGHHKRLRIRPQDRDAEQLFLMAPPIGPGSRPKPPNGPTRWIARRKGTWDAVWSSYAWDVLDRRPDDQIGLAYEPPEHFSDHWWTMARTRVRALFGPDPRATHPIRMPTTWSMDYPIEDLRQHRFASPADRPLPLVAVTSGTRHHPGHRARLAFLERLTREGLPLSVFGRGLPPTLSPGGPVRCKGHILRAARLAVVIENSSEGDLYVSEKLWDAILCGCVPLYHGSSAAEHMVPPESLIRLPDLDSAGVECVRRALADDALIARTQGAMNEARALITGPLRMVEWLDAILHNEDPHPALRPIHPPAAPADAHAPAASS